MHLVWKSDSIKVLLVLNSSLRAHRTGISHNFPETLQSFTLGSIQCLFLVFRVMWHKSLRLVFDRSGRGHSRVSAETRAGRYSNREVGSMHFKVELRFLILCAGQVPLPSSSSLGCCAGMLRFVSGKGRYGVEHEPGRSCGSAFRRASVLSQGEFGEAVGLILRRHTGYAEQGCCAQGLPWLANCLLLGKTVLRYQFPRCKCFFWEAVQA